MLPPVPGWQPTVLPGVQLIMVPGMLDVLVPPMFVPIGVPMGIAPCPVLAPEPGLPFLESLPASAPPLLPLLTSAAPPALPFVLLPPDGCAIAGAAPSMRAKPRIVAILQFIVLHPFLGN